jgi:signal transduction histidine kinase
MKMIRRLQAKFVIITMLVLVLVLGAILGTVNIWMQKSSDMKTHMLLSDMLDHDGTYKAVVNPDGSFLLFREKTFDFGAVRNAFAIRYNNVDNSIDIITPYPLHFTNAEISLMIANLIKTNSINGNYDGIRYALKKTDYGFLGAFVDRRIDDNVENKMATISIFIFIIALLFAMALSLIMSHWAVKPVKTAFIKQKQFVGDASHELKTPLTVIETNLSVLEDEVGKSVWSGYIHSEIVRMTELVKDLLFLAKYEDNEKIYEFKKFNISKAITGALLPFESVVFEKGRKLEYEITDGLMFYGDEKRIKQLAIIFLDNAVKHSEPTDLQKIPLVNLSLRQNGSKIELSVFNTGAGLDAVERKKVFERFYRSDSSRNRVTGGSGLGLAIASTIAQAHKSKITIESKVGEWVRFSVLL